MSPFRKNKTLLKLSEHFPKTLLQRAKISVELTKQSDAKIKKIVRLNY